VPALGLQTQKRKIKVCKRKRTLISGKRRMFAFRFKSAEKPTKSALDFKTIFRNQLEEGDNL